MSRDTLLVEIGCEEIPARMIRAASAELAACLLRILDRGGYGHGRATAWSGPRRLAVRVDDVEARQPDRDELVLGPPASVAFAEDGKLTRAALGFAKKQGVDPRALERKTNERGEYVGFERHVDGRRVGEVLAEQLPAAVASMSFPKTMRWADGTWRWVRPVHWLIALHGGEVLPVELFGIRASARSAGHRFLGDPRVELEHAGRYLESLRGAHVLADPAERRASLSELLDRRAEELGGTLVDDPALLDEVADLVEWPGAVAGRFDEAFLDLPRELLVTTLRHHQKCFSVQNDSGDLVAGFVAVANTDRDPAGHIRRGNEWVIGGRLHDARFFWGEDLRRPLESRKGELAGVVYHAKLGTYADKARRTARLAKRLAEHLGLDSRSRDDCEAAAALAKVDLVSGTVGEFPELQGLAGGLLLAAGGSPESVARGVYEHYRPVGPEDPVPSTVVGAVVSVADKLDTLAEMVGIGEVPTGSRDPFGLRRASSGLFRTILEKDWPIALRDLERLSGARAGGLAGFLLERFQNFLRDAGSTPNEIQAVFRPRIDSNEASDWTLPDITARLSALGAVRRRDDFAHLADLTKRVDNILTKRADEFDALAREGGDASAYREQSDTARDLWQLVERHERTMAELEERRRYGEVVDILAELVDPVERFFEDVLVLDPAQPRATAHRRELLSRLHGLLTRCFDIRELAGQAERRTS